MKHKKPGMSLGDAMKAAKKTWKSSAKTAKKSRRGGSVRVGGVLAGLGTPAGGRRSRSSRKTKKGGQLYTFAGGPYTGSQLADGAARLPAYPANMQWEGANPNAMTAGRRSRRSRRR
jgi:hypothetical protein